MVVYSATMAAMAKGNKWQDVLDCTDCMLQFLSNVDQLVELSLANSSSSSNKSMVWMTNEP